MSNACCMVAAMSLVPQSRHHRLGWVNARWCALQVNLLHSIALQSVSVQPSEVVRLYAYVDDKVRASEWLDRATRGVTRG